MIARSSSREWRALVAVFAVLGAGIAAWLAWSPLDANEVIGGDEGYYGVMARSIVTSPRYLLSPPLSPLGPPGDKPPLYPALLALSIRAFGPTEIALRWPSLAAAAMIALGLALMLLRAAGPFGALVVAAFFVSLPWLADASRTCAAEPALTACGTLALVLVTATRTSRTRDASAGALLGCAFLCKLWLVALIALPAAVALAPWTRAGGRRLWWVAACAFAVASLQLVAVALFQREAFAHWAAIYFGFSLTGRASGQGFDASWLLPPAAYWNLLAHALVLLMPMVGLGVADAARRWREPVPRALLAWAAGAAILSLFAVKSGGYAYVVMPAWIGLAALGLIALAEGRARSPLALLAGLVLVAPPVTAWLGGTPMPFMPWAMTAAASLVAWSIARFRPARSRVAASGLAAALIVAGLVRESQRLPQRHHVPGYRAAARQMAPMLEGLSPRQVCFVSPEAPALAFYLFRGGRYWGTPVTPWTPASSEAVRADTALRMFVVDSQRELYGGWPDSATVEWLEANTRELPATSAPARLRIFARGGPR